jgi:hypothetical protein
VFLWTFRPVTMLHRLLITLILYRHVFTPPFRAGTRP